ncbi:MAG: DNA-directed RNA polymerase subunit alpha [Dictyoglomus sp.]|nr:DNA-directed RNA polymerase subunit alpha [Dictyoglomus sp.]MCX7941835.1 DNA-directed RNA polymerase subunit alpha [Dictyoglomaceae bacterium]MDW8188063.1 DNA-directed RNA polymerase subunit alpha [Dictyoglomus sp.]
MSSTLVKEVDKLIEETRKVFIEELNETYGRFIIEPLERGFGWTIGNSLRRILLSSIEGAAVTAVKIEGIRHELDVYKGMKEDILEVLLNLKKIVVKIEDNETHILQLNVVGPKVVKAEDFKAPSNVKIINPDLVIATLVEEVPLYMEVEVRKGKGYVSAEENKVPGQPIGVINLDSIFSPVKKVSYEVEKTRVGRRTDLDRLVINIWTNGALSPDVALKEAAKILMDHAKFILEQDFSFSEIKKEESPFIKEEEKKILTLEDLGLSTRAYNALRMAGIHTIDELLSKTEQELINIKNFGQKSLQELKEKLKEKGYSLSSTKGEESDETS